MKSQTQIGNKKSTANSAQLKGKGSFMLTGNTFDPAPHESELHKVIESKAYLLAEENGFNGSPIDYWLAAEREVRPYY